MKYNKYKIAIILLLLFIILSLTSACSINKNSEISELDPKSKLINQIKSDMNVLDVQLNIESKTVNLIIVYNNQLTPQSATESATVVGKQVKEQYKDMLVNIQVKQNNSVVGGISM